MYVYGVIRLCSYQTFVYAIVVKQVYEREMQETWTPRHVLHRIAIYLATNMALYTTLSSTRSYDAQENRAHQGVIQPRVYKDHDGREEVKTN